MTNAGSGGYFHDDFADDDDDGLMGPNTSIFAANKVAQIEVNSTMANLNTCIVLGPGNCLPSPPTRQKNSYTHKENGGNCQIYSTAPLISRYRRQRGGRRRGSCAVLRAQIILEGKKDNNLEAPIGSHTAASHLRRQPGCQQQHHYAFDPNRYS